ncbi:hypothetical protein JCM8547_003049 [Rhodosporidiobolus lusitaniae]
MLRLLALASLLAATASPALAAGHNDTLCGARERGHRSFRRPFGSSFFSPSTSNTASFRLSTSSTALSASSTSVPVFKTYSDPPPASTTTTTSKSSSASAVSSSSSGSSSASTSTSTAVVKAVSTATTSKSFTPNGKKAGISAGDAFDEFRDVVGWWYDWSADGNSDHTAEGVTYVPMLWGNGHVSTSDASHLGAFKALDDTPDYVLGYEEPDCASGDGSAGIDDVDSAATLWDSLMGPLKENGTLLGSPSMCKQYDESGWLTPFDNATKNKFDFVAIHVNKNSIKSVRKDIDHYWNAYGQRPIWVTEFACVDDANDFTVSTNQTEINLFISDIVDLFEADERVFAYAYSNGQGLGSVWPAWDSTTGALSESGKTYLAKLQQYY